MFNSWKALFISCELLSSILASTHWVVTENGRIQSQEDSPFNLRRPYDLLALLEQERRVREVDGLYRELARRKATIDRQWAGLEGAGDLEARLNAHDEDCLNAGRPLSDNDLYANLPSDDLDQWIRLEEFLPEDVPEGCDEQPDCRKAVKLDFSMQTFEHLGGMARRGNLSVSANEELASLLLGHSMSLEEFGQQVSAGLQENASNWMHHNLASIYWQMVGHAPNAMECARRAVHLAPRKYRGAALLNMGSIFHLAHMPKEAAIVLHAAVDHHPLRPESHFVLGNVYAVLGDTNRSVACYENAMSLRPEWEHAARAKHILLCHRKLEQGLLQLHGSLQGILAELHGYHSQQEQWLRLQERLMREKAPPDHTTLSAMLGSRVQSCRKKVQEGHSVLSCDLGRENQRLALGLQMDITHSLQALLKNVESQAKEISKQLSSALEHLQDGTPSAPNSSQLKGVELPGTPWEGGDHAEHSPAPPAVLLGSGEEWPSQQQCADLAAGFPDLGNFPSVYLPPENKGFQVRLYLGELLGLPFGAVHKLPWSPPLCGQPHPLPPRDQEHPAEPHLRTHLLKYVNDGRNEDTEIGQRILTAINKEVGPSWMLQTLASLYWRARGNPHHAIGCLETALSSVPGEYRDVPLVSLGSLLTRLGRLDEAAALAEEALVISSLEPSTHFLLASVLSARGNFSGAAHHLRQVLRLDPNFISDGTTTRLLLAVSCRLRFGGHGMPGSDDADLEDMCGAQPVSSSRSSVATMTKYFNIVTGIENLKEGETLICSPDGEQCRAVQCFSTNHDTNRGASIMTLEPDAVSCLLTHGLDHCGGRHGLPEVARVGTEDQDETELERMTDEVDLPKQFHMRISFSEEGSLRPVTELGDLIVPVSLSDDPMPESWLRKDRETNTYPLSPGECERIRSVDWEELAAIGYRTAMRDINVELPPAPPGEPEPLCQLWVPPSSLTLDHLDGMRARHRVRLEAEQGAAACLGAITGLQGSSARELGTRIAAALQENATSWVLATAAALYWRAVGNTNHAISCLRQALQYVPSSDRDIPLVSLASLLHRAGFFSDALVVANMALDLAPKSEITFFTVANIHTSLGDLEKAIAYHRTSLLLQPGFEPARVRLQSILCSLVFEDHAVKTGP